MNNLIQITQTQFNGAEINSVNAREFYTFLGLKKSQFARWSNKHIVHNEYAFENIDYIGFDTNVEGNVVMDYALDADFAYKIAMKSKGSKAEEIRNMFIKLKNDVQSKALMSPNQITEALALTAQSLTHQDERLDSQHERINDVEKYIQEDLKSRPVSFVQQKDLLDAKNKKVYQLSDDAKIQAKLHMKVWSVFKKNFHLPRYNELTSVKFAEGIWFLNNLEMNDML